MQQRAQPGGVVCVERKWARCTDRVSTPAGVPRFSEEKNRIETVQITDRSLSGRGVIFQKRHVPINVTPRCFRTTALRATRRRRRSRVRSRKLYDAVTILRGCGSMRCDTQNNPATCHSASRTEARRALTLRHQAQNEKIHFRCLSCVFASV